MKAGVYRTPNGNLIYVAKDRTVKATTLKPSSWPGTKVSHRASDNTVLLVNTYRCTHISDVPNGCNDAQGFIDNYHKVRMEIEDVYEQAAKNLCEVAAGGTAARLVGAHPSLAAPYGAAQPREADIVFRQAGALLALEAAGDLELIDGGVRPLDNRKYFEAMRGINALDIRPAARVAALRKSGFRFCRAQSKRKHRKAGHEVFFVPEIQMYAWRE